MHTFESAQTIEPAGSPKKLTNVILVGSLHVGAIYTLLVALDVVPNPLPPPLPPISVHVLDQAKTTPPPSSPTGGVALAHPSVPADPTQPQIDILNPPTGPIAITPTTGGGPDKLVQPNARVSVPLRSVASTHTIPPYPAMGIRLGYEGTVRLHLAVDEHGNVVSADVLSSSGHVDLDDAAVNWVKTHWRYEPAVQDGNAVPATTNAVVTFTLNQLHG